MLQPFTFVRRPSGIIEEVEGANLADATAILTEKLKDWSGGHEPETFEPYETDMTHVVAFGPLNGGFMITEKVGEGLSRNQAYDLYFKTQKVMKASGEAPQSVFGCKTANATLLIGSDVMGLMQMTYVER
jgi:hypothetical protein